jgi:hypothetical protein
LSYSYIPYLNRYLGTIPYVVERYEPPKKTRGEKGKEGGDLDRRQERRQEAHYLITHNRESREKK